jgi:NAD+ kinase
MPAMSAPFKTVGVVGKFDGPNLAAPLERIVRVLRERECAVVLDARSAGFVPHLGVTSVDLERIGAHADLAVVVGGDGTLLSAARIIAPHGVPLVGINLGRLGFLTDIPIDAMEQMLGELLDGDFEEEDRTLLEARVLRGGEKVFSTLALNDVVVSKGATGSMIEFEVYVDRQFAYNLRSDGLIIATPTGSTAYALSSGGPILHPALGAISLVPISPHTLSNRPIALPDRSTVDVILVRATEARVNADVQAFFDLVPEDKVIVGAYDRRVRLLHPRGYSYYAMLREKLHWSAKL